ncbi:MAG: DUF664 domain-containing protein [Chloroflexi bacterium]|nr:DUF664 domain-containing protein [Chloroflexota bacterium]
MHPFFQDYLDRLAELHLELEKAIDGLSLDALQWTPDPDINSLTVLVVHVTGAERYWIGDVALQLPSNRNRASEFEAEGLNEEALRERLQASRDFAREALDRLRLEDLDLPRASSMDGREVTVGWALLHALEHTAQHAGHAQMMRQLWQQQM